MAGPRNSTPAMPPRLHEVTLVAKYEPPWKSAREEIAAIQDGRWHPSSHDFNDVGQTPNLFGKVGLTDVVNVSHIGAMAGALQKMVRGGRSVDRPDHVVRRLNIISHGMPGVIALSGTLFTDGRCILGNPAAEVDARKGGERVPELRTQIDEGLLSWLNDENDDESGKLGKAYRDIIRSKLTEDAEIWLILCRGASGKGGLEVGAGPVLAMQLANTFNATVVAFSDEVMYWPLEDLPVKALEDITKTSIPKPRVWTSIGRRGEKGKGYPSAEEVYYPAPAGEKKRLGWHMEKHVKKFRPTHPKE